MAWWVGDGGDDSSAVSIGSLHRRDSIIYTRVFIKMCRVPLHNACRLIVTMLSLQHLYDAYATSHVPPVPEPVLSAMQQFSKRRRVTDSTASGFERMRACRRALEALDRQGWERSYHQRLFHENFLKACSRIFWKTEKAGQFQRDHQKILQINGWTHLSQVWVYFQRIRRM